MNDKLTELPVPVLKNPHWRVLLRPSEYIEDRIPTLSECFKIIEKTKLRLRGWDYPHLSNRREEIEQGNNWVASWSNFAGHYEYWRFYQSGQFLHLFSVKEFDYEYLFKSEMKSHRIIEKDLDLEKVPGFISIINFIYTITEIFEFAARLCQKGIYTGKLTIQIDIKEIKGFVLSAPFDRAWFNYYAATQVSLSKPIEIETEKLIAASLDYSLSTIIWFFERFGWLDPSKEIIRQDQENLIKGRF